MKKTFNLTSIRSTLIVIGAIASSVISAKAQDATATISAVQSRSGYDYTITLNNTGNTQFEAFWYGWTQAGNNLAVAPTSAETHWVGTTFWTGIPSNSRETILIV